MLIEFICKKAFVIFKFSNKKEKIMNHDLNSPPTYFFGSIILMIVIHFLFPIESLISTPYNFLGPAVIILSLYASFWASNYFEKVNTTVIPFEKSSQLVTVGLFKFTRNPMYLSMLVCLIGLGILLGSLSPFIFVPIFFTVINFYFIRGEEKMMEETFGKEYLSYKNSVRRWI